MALQPSRPGGSSYLSGSAVVGIWARKAGVWTKIADHAVFIYAAVGGSGQQTVQFNEQVDVNMGPGVEAFGITLESHNGVAASVTDLVSVSWSASASSGERSATPGGQLSTVSVVPR